ncbi:MAG: hypothetical protein OSB57_01800 [Planctomycetota bacterium]|nr:hypothetical protein [Planctomycetota bacterium]
MIRERLDVEEKGSVTVMDRLTKPVGTYLLQADVESIVLRVFDTTSGTPGVMVYSELLDVEDVIEDVANTALPWDRDTIGSTFRHVLEGYHVFKSGGKTYRLEYVIETDPEQKLGQMTVTKFVDVRSRLTSA